MEAKLKAMQARYTTELQALQDGQQELTKLQSASRKFVQQLSENEMVMQELKLLEEDATVYKLVGPVLVSQDPVEARSNVTKRLEFIQGELDRLDSQMAKLQEKQSKRQQQMQSIEQQLQAMDTASAGKERAAAQQAS